MVPGDNLQHREKRIPYLTEYGHVDLCHALGLGIPPKMVYGRIRLE